MRTQTIDYVLWCATTVVMIAIAAYMLRGRLYREFPFFFNYLAFQIGAFAVEFPLRNWVSYYYVYWVINALGVFVSSAVLIELVRKIVRLPKALTYCGVALVCCSVLLVLVTVAAWRSFAPGTSIDNTTNSIYLADRTLRFAQFALAFFLIMFGAAMGISKRALLFGIAVGFGLFSVVNFMVMASLSYASLFSKRSLSRINAVAYVISMLIWLGYIATAAKKDGPRELSGA